MCGIVAQFGDSDPDSLGRMLSRLVHRGPDEGGEIRLSTDCWLGHRRLSIVDVESGRQPITTEVDGTKFHIVGNGEIYNHEDVREQLLPDVPFSTRSDQEVALHVAARLGPGHIEELKGMFAFVVGGEDGSFIAARDPVGIKPLFWARRGDTVLFASELRSFDPEWQPAVEVFPPGHYWTPEEGLVRFSYAVPRDLEMLDGFDGPAEPGSPIPGEVLGLVRDRLIQTVERQMMGDVPVGVFLSGGLDSNLVAAIAARWARRNGTRLKTFAVGLEDSPDLEAARGVAEYLDTEHHEATYTAEEAVQLLPEVVRAIESFDPKLVHSAVPNYILARFAARHVKVVLTGEGADEIFAGYEYMEEIDDEEKLHSELIRTIEGLHNLNLQRGDRVTMAHSLEARVPFLELDMISLGLSLPAGWKLAGKGQPEKRLLRLAFDGWLPDEYLWRKKAQFGDGSGASSVLKKRMEHSVSEEEFEEERFQTSPPLRSREEVAYYRIFSEYLRNVRTEQTVGRFATA